MNVWLISPYTLFRQVFEASLASLPGIIVSGVSQSISAFLNQKSVAKDVLVLWLLTQKADHEAFPIIRTLQPGQKVLCLAFSWTPERARAALQAGVAGCVDASVSLDELALALRQASRGEVALSTDLQRTLILDWATQKVDRGSSYEALSAREREVLTWVCQGLSNKQIAQSLYLSVRTVENHLSKIYAKLGVNSRTEAAVIALQNGWVESPNP